MIEGLVLRFCYGVMLLIGAALALTALEALFGALMLLREVILDHIDRRRNDRGDR